MHYGISTTLFIRSTRRISTHFRRGTCYTAYTASIPLSTHDALLITPLLGQMHESLRTRQPIATAVLLRRSTHRLNTLTRSLLVKKFVSHLQEAKLNWRGVRCCGDTDARLKTHDNSTSSILPVSFLGVYNLLAQSKGGVFSEPRRGGVAHYAVKSEPFACYFFYSLSNAILPNSKEVCSYGLAYCGNCWVFVRLQKGTPKLLLNYWRHPVSP